MSGFVAVWFLCGFIAMGWMAFLEGVRSMGNVLDWAVENTFHALLMIFCGPMSLIALTITVLRTFFRL